MTAGIPSSVFPVAALVAAASAGLWVLWRTDGSLLVLSLVLTIMIYLRHSENSPSG